VTADSSSGVVGYQAVHAPHQGQFWGGLEHSGSKALLDGSVGNPFWFYSIGVFDLYQGGIPGPGIPVQKAELYAWVPPAPTPTPATYMYVEGIVSHGDLSSPAASEADARSTCSADKDCLGYVEFNDSYLLLHPGTNEFYQGAFGGAIASVKVKTQTSEGELVQRDHVESTAEDSQCFLWTEKFIKLFEETGYLPEVAPTVGSRISAEVRALLPILGHNSIDDLREWGYLQDCQRVPADPEDPSMLSRHFGRALHISSP